MTHKSASRVQLNGPGPDLARTFYGMVGNKHYPLRAVNEQASDTFEVVGRITGRAGNENDARRLVDGHSEVYKLWSVSHGCIPIMCFVVDLQDRDYSGKGLITGKLLVEKVSPDKMPSKKREPLAETICKS